MSETATMTPPAKSAPRPAGKKSAPRAHKAKKPIEVPKEVREGKKPGVYVHIIRLLMRHTKVHPLTDAICFEALKKVKELRSRFATEEGADGVERTMKDAYRRTLITRMGWPVKEATDKNGKVIGWYLDPKAKSSDEFQQRKWERLNAKPAKK